jgi:hypothetical protein
MVKKRELPPNIDREHLAAIFRERIYGSITVLAVNIGLLLKVDDGLTVRHAFITIISTIVGLWLAGIFSAVLSYRIVHEKNMSRIELAHEFTIHRGLLLAGWSTIIMLTLAALSIISLHTAILTDIILTVTALTFTILRGTKAGTNTFTTAVVSVALQAGIVAVVVLLKTWH